MEGCVVVVRGPTFYVRAEQPQQHAWGKFCLNSKVLFDSLALARLGSGVVG